MFGFEWEVAALASASGAAYATTCTDHESAQLPSTQLITDPIRLPSEPRLSLTLCSLGFTARVHNGIDLYRLVATVFTLSFAISFSPLSSD
jgi:hypothetical protein